MKRYEEFIMFAEKHNYFFNDEEKTMIFNYFLKKPCSFPENFGKKFYFSLIMDFFKEKNLYKSAFNPLNV